MPALVEGLIEGAGLDSREAGMVGSSNVYGAALGALLAVFVVKHIRWRRTAYILLAGLIAIALFSTLIQRFWPLLWIRFLHGAIGGLLVGIGFSIIARTTQADRTFGYLLLVQFGLGGLGLMYLPPLVPIYGTRVLFGALVLFSLVTALMLPFLTVYPADAVRKPAADGNYGLVINLGVVALLGCLVVAMQPARLLDRAHALQRRETSGVR